MRFPSLFVAVMSGLLGYACAGSGGESPAGPSGAAGTPAWREVRIDAGAGGEAAEAPLTDAELDRMLDALEQQINTK